MIDLHSTQLTFDSLYAMKEHEVLKVDTGRTKIQVIRVPHGWIYTIMDTAGNFSSSSVFVPFINSRGEE